jgi:hypothetical protein
MSKSKGSRDVKIHERGKCRAYNQTDNRETEEDVRSLTFAYR